MSSTVTYKGNTIATVSNTAKTLTTAGTWLEDDIRVVDSSVDVVLSDVANATGTTAVISGEEGHGYSINDIVTHNYGVGNVVTSATRLYPYEFSDCTGMTSFVGDSVYRMSALTNLSSSGVGQYVFSGCTNLQSVSLASMITCGSGGYQFYNCTSLNDVYMPLGNIGQHMFEGCSSLVRIAIQSGNSASNMNGYGFNNCTSLEIVDLGDIIKTGSSEFAKCSSLRTIILRRTSAITALSNVNCFTSTPYASGGIGGVIYAPSSLIDTYKAATNWSTIDAYGTITWLPIEGSIYETTYADGRQIVPNT